MSLDLDELERMTPAELRAKWREVCRVPAPAIGPSLLARGIAHRLQERAHGSLPSSTVREIDRLRKRLARTGSTEHLPTISLKTGTRLVRSWHGKTYQVLVCDKGFEFEGRHYDSLSHIAREITGAGWSGPRFFGLRKRRSVQNHKQVEAV
ncbi:MAG: DUF2924 domain-containing protein [Pacificimonas sp.]